MSSVAGSGRREDFGATMKRQREERGIQLRDIAEATKISIVTLEALEKNDLRRLPSGIFLRGMVRAYAVQIGADPEKAVRDFTERGPGTAGGAADLDDDADTPSAASRVVKWFVLLVVLLMLAVAIWFVDFVR